MSLKTHLKIAHFSRSNISFRDFGVIKIVAVKFIQVTFQSKKISHTWRLALHFVFLILRPRYLKKEINIFSFQHIFQSSAFYKNSYNQLFRIYLIILTADIFLLWTEKRLMVIWNFEKFSFFGIEIARNQISSYSRNKTKMLMSVSIID